MAMAAAAPSICALTPDDVEQNKEQHCMEVEMLQSIFDCGEIVVLNPGSEYRVKVVPKLKDKIALMLLASCDQHQTSLSDSSSSREVTHLAGVSLYIKYSPSYPSNCPPQCHLSACWMEPQGVISVLENMRGMFEPHCLVVYDWIMYLQDDMVQDYIRHQGLGESTVRVCRDEQLNLLPTSANILAELDEPYRILLRSTSLIQDMVEYDHFEKFQEFQSDQHMCGVCYGLVKGVLMCQPCCKCGLVYCKECLLSYCKSCVGDSRIVQLECPDANCHEVLVDTFLKEVLPGDFFCRYVALREKVELDSLPGMVFCPRCKHRTMSDPDSKVAMCDNQSCQFPFCKMCQQTWHGPGKCPALEKLVDLAEEGDMEQTVARKTQSEEDKQRRIEELKSVLWVLSTDNVQSCPSCRTSIQKNSGCNKMSCVVCGMSFCWICGKPIMGYSHFDVNGRCALFRDEDYLPAVTAADVEGFDDLKELEDVINTKCPRCGKIEVKSSDSNWLHCRRCSFQYCHSCGEPCFGLYHFNEKYGCKKYSSIKDDVKRTHEQKKLAVDQ